MIVLPYNNTDAVERIIQKNKNHLAAVIVEPMMSSAGIIPAKKEFLMNLRQITANHNVLLILDEVQTFRFSTGGAQAIYGVKPDLTALGKIIGGGFPVGAVGGREDILQFLDSTGGKAKIPHSGTFNGNPITMVAGLATLKELTPKAFERLSHMSDGLRKGLSEIFNRYGVPAQVTGAASFFKIHFKRGEITDYRSAVTGIDKMLERALFMFLLNHDIFCTSALRCVLSTPMTERETNTFLNRTEDFVKKIM